MPMDITPWSLPPAGSGERRMSNSSDGSSGSGYSKTNSTDTGTDYLQTRTKTINPCKPATNPLQFIKVKPCDLYRSAQEQVKRAEQVKKSKELKREDQEDWQSNLDNWKSSRRKRVEHIIERCVEVKKLESLGSNTRGKGKTFNEMLEERSGRRRYCPLLYADEEITDLSDLGIGTSSTKSSLSEDCDTHSMASDGMDLEKHSDVENISNCGSSNRKLGSSSNEYDTCTTTTISSPEPEEYTYEGAIESYKSRVISKTNTKVLNSDYKPIIINKYEPKEKSPDKNNDIKHIRTEVNSKIDEKVNAFQQNRINEENKVVNNFDKPKVDISKRRELFERENSNDSNSSKPKSAEIGQKSIKERLSSLEKLTEDSQKSNGDYSKIPVEVIPLKERLSSLGKVAAAQIRLEKPKPNNLSNGDLANTKSVRDRLSCLKSQTSLEEVKKIGVTEVSTSLKERLTSLNAAINKDEHNDQENNNFNTTKDNVNIENLTQSFTRSLDRLDVNDNSENPFERVQSLEDLPRDLHHTASDQETEDSGVHTANGSCAVSQVDEHADILELTAEITSDNQQLSSIESNEENMSSQITEIEVKHSETENDQSKHEDTESISIYTQAISQPDDVSVTEDITEIQLDKEDEDTLKSIENQDISVSPVDPISTSSEDDMVFEGKMLIHFDLNDICKNKHADTNTVDTNASKVQTIKISNIYTTNITSHSLLTDNAACSSNANSSHYNESLPDPNHLSSQDFNPFWEKKRRRNQEPNRRRTILRINNSKHVVDALELAFEEMDSEEKIEDVKINMADLSVDSKNKMAATPDYENIEIFYNNGGVLVTESGFPLDLPAKILEPPKEKPPPPPVEDDTDELIGNGNFKSTRSTRRIKKEIYNKRSSFLGIEGQLEDIYLDTNYNQTECPDITSFLREERKLEKLYYNKTLNDSSDNKLSYSRDSGVDCEKMGSTSPDCTSHGRQNSEPYMQLVMTSDEADPKQPSHSMDNGAGIDNTDGDINNIDRRISEQQVYSSTTTNIMLDRVDGIYDDNNTKEVLRFERELLELEHEELQRQRENLLLRETHLRKQQKSCHDVTVTGDRPIPTRRQSKMPNYRHSMPDLNGSGNSAAHFDIYGNEDWCRNGSHRHPPAPVPPIRVREKQEIEIKRTSRTPSGADYVNIDRQAVHPRPKPIIDGQIQSVGYHHMSKHTLQTLSAAPTSKFISNNEWLRSRKYNNNNNYNQHWLVQEAEQRRIEEQRMRGSKKQHVAPQQLQAAGSVHTRARHTNYHDYVNINKIPNGGPQPQRSPQKEMSQVQQSTTPTVDDNNKVLSVSGRRKCSHCSEELGRGAAMIIESLGLCFHVWCFTCSVCGATLGDGREGTDVRVRNNKLHCALCRETEDGTKCSAV